MDEKVLTQLVDVLSKQTTLIDQISKEREEMRFKTPASTQTATALHGSAGIFTGPGLERDVVSAHVRPYGLAAKLLALPSVNEDPRFASLTGYTATTGSEPTNACDDAPAGYVKSCNLTARFGMLRRDTQTVEMDKVMLRLNRGDFSDLILRGRVLGLANLAPSGMDESGILDIITKSEMVGAAVQAERALSQQMWQGTYGTGTEFPGLDVQIATGQKDADTGTLCPALDSDVKDYNMAALSNTIVEYLSQLEWYLRHNAYTMGLEPVEWVVAMRPELWFELSALWPCAYNTSKCAPAVATNSTVFIDGRENVSQRDAMRNGMYIDINGNRYPVIVDTGIFEKNSTNTAGLIPGQYASSIYMIPLTIVGNMPVTYREYVDYRGASRDTALLRGMESYFWTDNGMFSWAIESTKWCYKLALKTEQRVILRTPQLAGRIDDVMYEPLQHLREPYPDSPYFYDGGVSLRSNMGTLNAVWG